MGSVRARDETELWLPQPSRIECLVVSHAQRPSWRLECSKTRGARGLRIVDCCTFEMPVGVVDKGMTLGKIGTWFACL